jgi:hypothetical protein
MPVTYTNRKGQITYLHQRTTKSGKPSYHFAFKSEGELVETLPDGFEIYESPNGQVFLRRIQREIITSQELDVVNREMKRHRHLKAYKAEVKAHAITLFEPDQDVDGLSALISELSGFSSKLGEDWLAKHLTYAPIMRFILLDETDRTFVMERRYFSDASDQWISVGLPGKLTHLARTYIKHLGRESFFDMGMPGE